MLTVVSFASPPLEMYMEPSALTTVEFTTPSLVMYMESLDKIIPEET